MYDYYLIHHGPETQPTNGAKGGVAIVLSPELAETWKNSGKAKKITRGGTSVRNTTRFLSVNLRFEFTNKKQKTFRNLCLTTIYFPHSGYKEKELETFNDEISNLLSNILATKNTMHIIGADVNASIGIRPSYHSYNHP
jgi:hypothetical protein